MAKHLWKKSCDGKDHWNHYVDSVLKKDSEKKTGPCDCKEKQALSELQRNQQAAQ